jgi:hypothetical protein
MLTNSLRRATSTGSLSLLSYPLAFPAPQAHEERSTTLRFPANAFRLRIAAGALSKERRSPVLRQSLRCGKRPSGFCASLRPVRQILDRYADGFGLAGPHASPNEEVLYLLGSPFQCALNRAQAKLAIGDLSGALSDYSLAIQLTPNNAELYGRRGVVLLRLNRPVDANADFAMAQRLGGIDHDLSKGNVSGLHPTS